MNQGLHILVREGVTAGVAGFERAFLVGDGEPGRGPTSARRIYLNGVRFGDPSPGDEEVLRDCGLVPSGADNCRDGNEFCPFGSGVVGLLATRVGLAIASRTVAAVIHRSSFRGGDGGSSASKSAK